MGTIFGIKIKLLNIFTSFVPHRDVLVGFRIRDLSAIMFPSILFYSYINHFLQYHRLYTCYLYKIVFNYYLLSFENLIYLLFDVSNIRHIVHTYLCDEKNTYIIIIYMDNHPIRFSYCYLPFTYVY